MPPGMPNSIASTDPSSQVHHLINTSKEAESSISPTMIIPLMANNGLYFRVRTLLDSGSGTNWISRKVLDRVKHTVKGKNSLEVFTFAGTVKQKFTLVEVYIHDEKGKIKNIVCYVQDQYTKHVSAQGIVSYVQFNHTTPFSLAKPISDPNSVEVDHSDAADSVGMILCSATTNTLRTSDPIVVLPELKILLEPTIYGTAISGAIPKSLKSAKKVSAHQIATRLVCTHQDPQLFLEEDDVSLADDISFLWKQEQLGIAPKEPHDDDKKAWDMFINSVHRHPVTGQFTVRLPFNNRKHMISDNASIAAARTVRQLKLMIDNPKYGEYMIKAKNELVENDFVEKVSFSVPTGDVLYYMPFRGILKHDSETTKCRLVMDASSKASASHISLNQALYQGPNLILDLAFTLLKFIRGTFAAIADLEKAFLRIVIALCDRDALRFFWPADPTNLHSKLEAYRFKVVMFGSAASPFQLAAVLHVLVTNDCADKHVQHALLTRIYVDDVSYTNDSESAMVKFFNVATTTCKKGSFNLRQWASNSPALMEQAKQKDIANESNLVKILGMYWNINVDLFSFNTNIVWDGKFTRRSALRFCNRIFDPLGYLIPIVIRLRLFIQKLWDDEFTWDTSYEYRSNWAQEWVHLVYEAQIAVTSTKPRQTIWTNDSELHIFSDASKDAYGTVVYTRTPPSPEHPDGKIDLVCAKGKVAPLEPKQTIPRMELLGAVLAAHKVPYMMKAWELQKVKVYIWSDAVVVLSWLSQYNIKDGYVNNRVNQIRQLCKPVQDTILIKHVPTSDNPADIITRKQEASEFIKNSTWWAGPQWLLKEENWPISKSKYDLYPKECEESTMFATVSIDVGKTSILSFFDNVTFCQGLRTMARILRFIANNNKRRIKNFASFGTKDFTKPEMDQAKTKAIQIMQSDMFLKELQLLKAGKDITTGPYRKWGLHLTTDGIIRCTDRTLNSEGQKSNLDPILVHGKHPFTESFIRFKHVHSNCSSKQYTLHVVRREVHGPSLTVTINRLVRECNICRILRAAPYAYPQAPLLPIARLAAQRPFAVCGVDYSGPHFIKQGRSRVKIWIALFSCMVSRAIHIETVPDLSAETFHQALQAMAWTRGAPRALMSDNATCFTKADKILQDLHKDRQIQENLAIKGITWDFTPVKAAWFGAIYERLIGVIKKELIKLIGQALLTYHELRMCLAQVQGVINNRPLIQVGSDQVISPMNILTGRSDNNEDILNVIDTKDIINSATELRKDLPKLYQETSQRLCKFWKVFQDQYLNSIRFTSEPEQKHGTSLYPKVGDLVIIHSHDPRLKWRKAIILENIPSEDGKIRRCKVKTSTGQTIRAVKHLYPLEINVETFIDHIKEKEWPQDHDFEGFEGDHPSNRGDKILALREKIAELQNE